jgi:hypothetical protein
MAKSIEITLLVEDRSPEIPTRLTSDIHALSRYRALSSIFFAMQRSTRMRIWDGVLVVFGQGNEDKFIKISIGKKLLTLFKYMLSFYCNLVQRQLSCKSKY